MALLYSTLTVIILIYGNHLDYIDDMRATLRPIVMTVALGIPLSLSVYLLFEAKPNINKQIRILVQGVVPVILVLLYFLYFREIDYVSGTKYVGYTIALYLIFTLIPYISRRGNYEIYVIKLFSRFVVTYVYSLVLYLGLAAILVTINLLFNADISGKIFGDIGFIVAGIFAPGFFLADIPKKEENISIKDYPKVLKVLLKYIIMPLLSVYTVILYIYFGKIVVIRALPEGIIGNLVLWYSIISTITFFFIYPLRDINQWIKKFLKIIPKAIIPLLGLMFLAIGIRINSYGITESRYFVVLIGLWLAFSMIYYSIKKDIKNIIIIITLVVITIIGVTGPLSSYSISKWSQNRRFKSVLEKYDMIGENLKIKSLPKEKSFTKEDKNNINSVILYFDRYHDLDDIKYLPNDFKIKDMNVIFGFELYDNRIGPSREKEFFNYSLYNKNTFSDISDFDYFKEFNKRDYNKEDDRNIGLDIDYNIDNNEFIIKNKKEIIYKKSLYKVVKDIYNENRKKRNIPIDRMTYTDETENIKIKIIFKGVYGYKYRSNDELVIRNIEFYSFIKVKE
ncbi:DUF4153 domain-containing protein [Dethiothermospora halolimnae]|uniref:DUF4153 domain-containing protein n=1 Tax=Dethiothermospora halolimnae TaxID=3114390 RepID=UPI003CCC3B66